MAQRGRPEGTGSLKTRRVLKLMDLQIAQDDALKAQERARMLAREVTALTEQEQAPKRDKVPA